MHITGNQVVTVLIVGISLLGWALLFRTLFAAREGILWTLKAALIGALAMILAQKILVGMHRSQQEVTVGSYLAAGIAVAVTPQRKRYIPPHVKRQVIARYERKTGKKYNSHEVEIDHRWPFSRGGSNTADNLRAISKAENRRKAAKKPGLKDWL